MAKCSVMALSGGMDSTALLMHLLAEGHEVHALSYDYGQKHRLELDRAKANVAYLASNDSSCDVLRKYGITNSPPLRGLKPMPINASYTSHTR